MDVILEIKLHHVGPHPCITLDAHWHIFSTLRPQCDGFECSYDIIIVLTFTFFFLLILGSVLNSKGH